MPEMNYTINSLYISIIILLYNIFYTNYDKILNLWNNFLFLLGYNYTILIIIINLIGLYLFLKKLSFEINIRWTIQYK
jgi:hypothetical protein